MRSPERLNSPSREAALPSSEPSSSGVVITNETKHLADRLQTALVKVKRLQRLEAALADLFAEVVERTDPAELGAQPAGGGSDHEAAFRRARWKEGLLKKADGDPMSLLNALRTHLRVQLAILDQRRREVAQDVAALASRSQVREQDARDAVRELEAAGAAQREQIAALARQVAASEAEKTRLAAQHRSLVDSARAQLAQTRARQRETERTVEQQTQQLGALKDANEQLQTLVHQLRSREEAARGPHVGSPLAPATGGASASALQPCGSVRAAVMGNTPAENHKLRRALRDAEARLDKSEAAREQLSGEAQRLHKQIVGYRQSTQTQSFVRLEKEEKRLQELASELKDRLAESEAELLRARGALKEREALLQQMRAEYNKLFTALQKHKAPPQSPGKLARVASCVTLGKPPMQSLDALADPSGGAKPRAAIQSANDNPYLVDLYRGKVEELEGQVEGLKVQIRKMIASEYRHKQQNRAFRAERKQLVDASDRLRADLETAVLTSAKSMAAAKALAANEPPGVVHANPRPSSRSGSPRTSVSGALNEVKRLRQRNLFLEERFRAVLQAASRSSREAAKSSDGSARDESNPAREACPAFEREDPSGRAQTTESGTDSAQDALSDDDRASAPTASSVAGRRGSSAGPRDAPSAGPAGAFRSLDPATLEALQKVKRTARVRPKSAAAVASAVRK